MPTTFIAVQCFQCSTMQVKQQKKSSNKWTCVVCNKKQSQRKVYAQAFMAKDVRLFVTSFNMSRKFADEQYETLDSVCEDEQIDEDRVLGDRKKKRTDWNEYLNVIDDDDGDRLGEIGNAGSNLEPKYVTELPTDMFKKPKLRNYSSGSGTDTGKGLLRPVFSKRNSTNKRNVSQDKEQIPCKATMKEAFKYRNHVTQVEQEPKPCQPSSMARVASKWDDYITPDEDDLELKSGRETAHDNWDDSELQILFEDEMVDEDIHPDFK